MIPKLYEMRHSPYCIPIVRILEAHGVPFERIEVPNWDRRAVALLTGGAYYQVPVLVDGERVIHETPGDGLAVARYLDGVYCGGTLFPGDWDGVHEILVDHVENELEGIGFRLADIHYVPAIEDVGERAMVVRHKERKFGRGCVEAWRERAPALAAEFAALLGRFERRLLRSSFLLGDAPVYVDYALYGVIGNVTFNGWNRLPDGLPRLADWNERMRRYEARLEGGGGVR